MSCILYETLVPDPFRSKLLSFTRSLSPDRYQDALAEAARIEKAEMIPMTVEGLSPKHFGFTDFVIPAGDTIKTLKANTALYPVGIWSIDDGFLALKWYRGARTQYLYDWMTRFVSTLLEKQQIMFPQPVFKGGETFTFTVASSVSKAFVDAWLLGYAVLPETLAELPLIR